MLVGTIFRASQGYRLVGQAARENRGAASGTYLACYFFGGLVGSAVLGELFDRFGWPPVNTRGAAPTRLCFP